MSNMNTISPNSDSRSSEPEEQVFHLPDLGEGLEDAEVVTWRVSVGDTVAFDEVFVEVETAKASVEIPSPFAGVVTTLHADPGDVVAVGAPLITITSGNDTTAIAAAPSQAGESTQAADTPTRGDRSTEPRAAAAADEAMGEEASGAVLVGYGTASHRTATRGRAAALPSLLPVRTRSSAGARADGAAPVLGSNAVASVPGPPATPPVRLLAKRLGVDLAQFIDGSVVTREQILGAAAARDRASAEVIPMRGIRRAIAEKVTRSRREIPEATAWVEVDVTDLWAQIADMNTTTGHRIRLLPVLCRAVVAALEDFPAMNSRLSEDGSQIELLTDVHLGIATSTERGLTVPVLRNAHRLSVAGLAEAAAAIAGQARADTLTPADLTGSTFTVNNYGVLGVDGGDPIINLPEVAILGVGRAIPRPWVVGGAVMVRRTAELVISADHRVVDGREAGGFLRRVADLLERPSLLWSLL